MNDSTEEVSSNVPPMNDSRLRLNCDKLSLERISRCIAFQSLASAIENYISGKFLANVNKTMAIIIDRID